MKFGPKIDDHDFDYRMKRILEFLEKGDKVKITVRFRGREFSHPELGYEIIDKVKEQVLEISTMEKPAKMEGRNLSMVLAPVKKK
jgi:translation initiation factor IF-3